MHYAIVALFFLSYKKCTHTTLRGSERSDLRGKGDASDVGVHEKRSVVASVTGEGGSMYPQGTVSNTATFSSNSARHSRQGA